MPGALLLILAVYGALFFVYALLPGRKSMAVAIVIGLTLGLWLYGQLTYNPNRTPGSLDLVPMANLMAAATISGVLAWAARMTIGSKVLRWVAVAMLFFLPVLLRFAGLI